MAFIPDILFSSLLSVETSQHLKAIFFFAKFVLMRVCDTADVGFQVMVTAPVDLVILLVPALGEFTLHDFFFELIVGLGNDAAPFDMRIAGLFVSGALGVIQF